MLLTSIKMRLAEKLALTLRSLIVSAICLASVELAAMESASKLFGGVFADDDTGTTVVLETTNGNIELVLFDDKAPASVANFLQYVNQGYYDGTQFHRVIDGFMIQGGGFDANMIKKETRAAIQNEADNGLLNTVGTLAMARTNAPHSATSQFFINVADNTFLNHRGKAPNLWGYAVFGEIRKGMEVIEAIKLVPTAAKDGHANVPIEPVIISKAYVVK